MSNTASAPEASTKRVSLRDLRAKMAHYLEAVAHGASFEVVSRGQVIAELRPPAPKAVLGRTRAETRGMMRGQIEQTPGWWEPSDELADLFEGSVI